MNWHYQGTEITNIVGDYTHFIYLITNKVNGKIYVGQKGFFFNTKKHFGKKKLAEVLDKRLKTYERVVKESDWKKYYGSCATLKEDVKTLGKESFTRQILFFCHKHDVFYHEARFQFNYNVLKEESYNDNILGRFYRGRV